MDKVAAVGVYMGDRAVFVVAVFDGETVAETAAEPVLESVAAFVVIFVVDMADAFVCKFVVLL